MFAFTAVLLAVFAALVVVYAPALRGAFVWDDDCHVTMESLRTVEGLGRIWYEVGATQQYYPLLHSAFWVQHALWGDASLGYHVVNVALHAIAVALFWLLLRRLEIPGAGWAAVIFAVHPVHVESVAWITEQKNTLSAVFYLAAALAYVRFDTDRTRRAYALVWPWFIMALLTKSVTATLPGALLVVLWWRRGRLDWRRDVLPVVPLFIVGALAGLFTAWVERALIGAEGSEYQLDFFQRAVLAGKVVWFYAGKLIWPAGLTFIYPRWEISAGSVWQWLPLIALCLVAWWLWQQRGRSRAPLAAALLFVGTLFPVLGFLNVYPFRFSFVADHFQYLASLGLIALAGPGLAVLAEQAQAFGRALATLVATALAFSSSQQAERFRDEITLWRHTVALNPDGPMPLQNFGAALVKSQRFEEAEAPLRRASELTPDNPEVLLNRAILEMFKRRFDAAIPLITRALERQPHNAHLHDTLGVALRNVGRLQESIGHHRQALALKPDYIAAQNNLGCALTDAGRPADALTHFEAALRVRPSDPELLHNRANALRSLGRVSEAVADYRRALAIGPASPETHDELGATLLAAGQIEDAIAQHRRAVELRPDWSMGCVNLGRALAQAGQLEAAIVQFRRAAELGPTEPEPEIERGMVLTRLDRWQEARDAFARAVELRPRSAKAKYFFGMALANTGALEASVSEFLEALEFEPHDAQLHAALGQVLPLLGRTEEAEKHRVRAAALSTPAK